MSLKIECTPINAEPLLTYTQIIEEDGIYFADNFLYVVQANTVFQWNHLTDILVAWDIRHVPNNMTTDRVFSRMPKGFKFTLTFSQIA